MTSAPAWGSRRSSLAPSARAGASGTDGVLPLLQQLRRAYVACICEDPPLAERAAAIAHNALQVAKRMACAPELDELALALACAMQGDRRRSRHHAVQASRLSASPPRTRDDALRLLELLVALARLHAAEGDGDSTERCARRARALGNQLFGDGSLEASDVCTALLPACAEVRPALAVDLAAAALLPRLRTLGLRHEATASSHRNLGLALLAAGEWEDAIGEYEEALQIERALHGDDAAAVRHAVDVLTAVRRRAAAGRNEAAASEHLAPHRLSVP
ncbi:hypothetical protein KFE25_002980 [Diacronema lutheri]|uniref:Tetratricopeptide repeat protein n=1 Tax=Diacronema lutheri TaxID=2081491 RepID=A0A8J5XJC1_DIALT|nr:hypothetical protein KFE25_002980 [Diacronema lutheri]